jgi:hypothetical protein
MRLHSASSTETGLLYFAGKLASDDFIAFVFWYLVILRFERIGELTARIGSIVRLEMTVTAASKS